MRLAVAAALGAAVIGTFAGVYFASELKSQLPQRPATPSAAAQPQSLEALFAAPLTDLDGAAASLARWRETTLVVNFWATWCPPCRDEMPDLSRLQQSHPGVRFVGVALDAPSKVLAFSAAQPVSYPLLIAAGDSFALSREVGNETQALPYTVIVKNGKLKWSKLGRIDAAQLDSYLQALAPSSKP